MSPHTSWILVHEVVPRLTTSIPRVNPVGAEDTEEIVQDASAMAARMLANAENNGKQVTAGNIAYYTLQHIKSGRRSVGYSNADVLGSATQLNGRSHVSSLDEPAAVEDELSNEFTVNDVFAGEVEDPSVAAARKMDWEEFMKAQDECTKAIVIALVEGEPVGKLPARLHVSRWTIQNRRQQLMLAIRAFMGEDVLTESIRKPAWRDGIAAAREKHACRLLR